MPNYFRRCRSSPTCTVERSFAPLSGAHKLLIVYICQIEDVLSFHNQGKCLLIQITTPDRPISCSQTCRRTLIQLPHGLGPTTYPLIHLSTNTWLSLTNSEMSCPSPSSYAVNSWRKLTVIDTSVSSSHPIFHGVHTHSICSK